MPEDRTKPDETSVKAIPLEEARRARGQALVAMPRAKVAGLRAFRRIRADRGFGAAGLLLVLIAVILIFMWPKPPTPVEKKYGVEWPEGSIDLGSIEQEIRVQGGGVSGATSQPWTHTFGVNHTNVTQIRFWITWKDDVAGPGKGQLEGDTFEVEVKPPPTTQLSTLKLSGTGGLDGYNISFAFPLAGIPDITNVPAKTEEEARAAIGDQTNDTGTGDWTFTVRLVAARPMWNQEELRDRAPCQAPYCTPDMGNKFTIHVDYNVYALRLKPLF